MSKIRVGLRGFLLSVVLLGALGTIAVPTCSTIRKRSELHHEQELERRTKAIMHVVRLAAEDFAVRNDSVYPEGISDGVPAEGLASSLPDAVLMKNAYTGVRSEPRLGPPPPAPEAGSVWYTPMLDSHGAVTSYVIQGVGRRGLLTLVLSSEI